MNNSFCGAKGIHITHLNIRSLMSKLDMCRHYLEESNISIATLSETWLHTRIPDCMLQMKGYQLVRLARQTTNNRNQTKAGGGLCVYVKDTIKIDTSTLAHLNKSNENIEARANG